MVRKKKIFLFSLIIHFKITFLKFSKGVTKVQASILVFFVSAFFHEYLISIPLRMFKLWSFFGMIMQVNVFFMAILRRKRLYYKGKKDIFL
jgi:hypothetical protein